MKANINHIRQGYYLLAIMGLCAACQPKTLFPLYTYQIKNTPTYWELRLDTTHQQFTLAINEGWESVEIPGYFSTFQNELHLIPLRGQFFKRSDSVEDSTYKLNVFYAEDREEVNIYSLRSVDRKIDTLISAHPFEFEVKESSLYISIWHIGHWSYLVKLQGPGSYDIFLYPNNYNLDILTWKIGCNQISSDALIMRTDKKP